MSLFKVRLPSNFMPNCRKKCLLIFSVANFSCGRNYCRCNLTSSIPFREILYQADIWTLHKYNKRNKQSMGIRRFGRLALTIYILGPLFPELVRQPINLIFGKSWSIDLLYVPIFDFSFLLFWHIILKLWGKVGSIGSLEWLTVSSLFLLSGKQLGKAEFKWWKFDFTKTYPAAYQDIIVLTKKVLFRSSTGVPLAHFLYLIWLSILKTQYEFRYCS